MLKLCFIVNKREKAQIDFSAAVWRFWEIALKADWLRKNTLPSRGLCGEVCMIQSEKKKKKTERT